ncbi:hypothetical protein ACWY4P_44315 [Streptomyces sp. LZ34]
MHIPSHFAVCRSLAAAPRRRGTPVAATNHFMPENFLGYTRLSARLAGAASRLDWRDLGHVARRARGVTAPPKGGPTAAHNGLASPVRAVLLRT